MSGSSHVFVFWFLVDSYQKIKLSAVNFILCLLFAEKINFLLVNQQKFSMLKLVSRSWKQSKQTWRLIFWSFGSYLPKTKRQKYEMNETLESLLPYIIKRQIIYYHLSFWILSDFLSLRRFCLRIFWIFFLSILPRILCIPIPLKVS